MCAGTTISDLSLAGAVDLGGAGFRVVVAGESSRIEVDASLTWSDPACSGRIEAPSVMASSDPADLCSLEAGKGPSL